MENICTYGGEQLVAEAVDSLSLRDYFIAHAPAEPQPWFEPVMPGPRPALPDYTELTPEQQQQINDEWPEFNPGACDTEVLNFCDRHHEAVVSRNAWDKERLRQKWIQWPVAWADAMLAARNAQR